MLGKTICMFIVPFALTSFQETYAAGRCELYNCSTIIRQGGALSHKYNLTEALFILHLNPIHPSLFRRVFYNNKYENDMMFYAKCITGAIACILRFEKKIPEDFNFDIIPGDNVKQCFIRNVSKLINECSKKFNNSNKIEQAHVKVKQD
ncbi:MAG: hypothetical protein IJU54_01160 [Alphaproteobacteria bacterium]|nr:hypothetical protein [Alphaproteobacteria bacterium]